MDKKNKFSYAFLLGRPGCGKSAIYRRLTEKLETGGGAKKFIRLDDFPVLKELLDKDTEEKRHVKKDGGFEVTDWTIIDEALQVLNDRLKNMKEDDQIIFIEFARGDNRGAMKNFTDDVLSDSVIFYIKSSFEKCLTRNRARFEQLQKDNTLDDHIVPEDLMNTYYKKDDYETLLNEGGEENLKKNVPARIVV
ncbi:MAG: hypothetical protein KAS39_08340, partial [Actinomycetia bacterium]|nr:hypothetical protein [Actinomycetes bacterium]